MAEIKAQIVGDSVILAGDAVKVCITISVPPLDSAPSLQSSEVCESIAWGSAQVHCICMINEGLVNLPQDKKSEVEAVTDSSTSFAPLKGENGYVVLKTKPKIIFCELQLLPGQSKSFIYKESIPSDAPPTFRGKLVKYMYKVTVGTQKLGSPINLLRLPIRVIVLQGLPSIQMSSETEELAPSNPFLHTPQRDQSRQAIHIIQGLSNLKNTSQYNISHPKGHVVSFTVYKNSFKLGEDIAATFEFTKAQIECSQYSATLQSEERIRADCEKRPNQKSVIVPYPDTKTYEYCLGFSHTHFLLPIPLSITPTFFTDIVDLKWSVHFEFVLNVGEKSNETNSENGDKSTDKIWKAPNKLSIETLVWDLPITILPTSPSQLSQSHGSVPVLQSRI